MSGNERPDGQIAYETPPFKRRVLGVGAFVVLGLFIWVTIGAYNKSFSTFVNVNLVVDSSGNSLPDHADVKVRGITVGEVRSSHSSGGKVNAVLAIVPEQATHIPENATARLLPKTLFGEKYVSLVIPEVRSSDTIQAGDTVRQDASGNAIELNALLDRLLPLLQAIPPQKLSSTLGAVSQALQGRGEALGVTIDRLDTIFTEVNAELPALKSALRGLATFSETYSDAAPQLVNALDNLRTTNATIVAERPQIDYLITMLTATGGATTDFLAANRDNIVSIAADSREALTLLATYSPEYGCVLANMAKQVPRIDDIMGSGTDRPGTHVTIELVNPQGRYLPNQDEPRWLDTRGPTCSPESPLGTDAGVRREGGINDGSYHAPTRNPGEPLEYLPVPQFSVMHASARSTVLASPMEQQALAAVYGAATGIAPADVPGWVTKIGAPALRGSEVRVN